MTRRSAGTTYTLFFGSGVPNDPNPAQIIGYGDGINPFVAPSSIGRLNYFTVLVFARYGTDVGWKQFKLIHVAAAGIH